MSSHSFARTLKDETGYGAGGRWRGRLPLGALSPRMSLVSGEGTEPRRLSAGAAAAANRSCPLPSSPSLLPPLQGGVADPASARSASAPYKAGKRAARDQRHTINALRAFASSARSGPFIGCVAL